MSRLCVLADDLTGAAEAGALFASAGSTVELKMRCDPRSIEQRESDVLILDTETRLLGPDAAYRRVSDEAPLAAELGAVEFVIKIDSTLRGSVGAQLDALLDEHLADAVVVCPTLPSQGRTVVAGRLLVDGKPVAQTAIGRDPLTPVRESHIPTLLARQTTRRIGQLDLVSVSSHPRAAAARLQELRSAGAEVIVADAVDDRHLTTIAAAAELAGNLLLCGSAGIVGTVAARRRVPRPADRWAPAGPGATVAVLGSNHPASVAQADRLSAAVGWQTVALDHRGAAASSRAWPAERERIERARAWIASTVDVVIRTKPALSATPPAGAAARISSRLADLAAGVIDAMTPSAVILTGGETAAAVMHRGGIGRLRVLGEVAPGIPYSRALDGRWPALTVVTKAGGFGDAGALLDVARRLQEKSR